MCQYKREYNINKHMFKICQKYISTISLTLHKPAEIYVNQVLCKSGSHCILLKYLLHGAESFLTR